MIQAVYPAYRWPEAPNPVVEGWIDSLGSLPRQQGSQLGRGAGPHVQRGRLDLRLGRSLHILQSLQQRSKLQRVEESPHGVVVPLPHHAGLWIEIQLQVAVQPGQVLVPDEVLSGGLDRRSDAALDLRGPVEELLHAAEILHQLGGGLLPDAGNPGDVVGHVPFQGNVVEVLLRGESEPACNRGDVVGNDVRDPPPVEHDLDAGADQLEEVAIGRDDHGLQPALRRSAGQGGDRVVGLVALHGDHGDLQGLENLEDQPELLAELVRCLLSSRLVVGVLGESNGRAAQVERDGDEVRPLVCQQLDEHRGESVDRVGDLPAGGSQRGGEGEECTEGQAVSVEEEDPLGSLGFVGGGLYGLPGRLTLRSYHHTDCRLRLRPSPSLP